MATADLHDVNDEVRLYPVPTDTLRMESEKEIRMDLPFRTRLGNLLYIGIVSYPTWATEVHQHRHFELCYVEEGHGWFTIDDLIYKVSPGDVFFTKPSEVHMGRAANDAPFRLYYLGFSFENMRTLEAGFYDVDVNRVARDDGSTLKSSFDAIIDEVKSNYLYNDLMVLGLMFQLLVNVLRIYKHPVEDGTQGPIRISPAIREVLDYIHGDLCNHPYQQNIEDLARLARMSRPHFCREFKRYIGIPIGQYLRTLCLDRAQYWLRETSETISNISEQLGFPSIHTFSIFFKRQTGMPPSEYRRAFK